jgi:hypothetical protein
MVGMPYLLVSGMGFYLYRGLKQSARRNAANASEHPGDASGA